jgi:hypothetical protein
MYMFGLSDTRRSLVIQFILWTALILFLVSLCLPVVSSSRNPRMVLDCTNPDWTYGWMTFVGGPVGIVVSQFGWFANPLMLFAVLKGNRKNGIAAIFALIAVALALFTHVSLTSIPNDNGANRVCGFGMGYYLWVSCSILVFIVAWMKPIEVQPVQGA